MFQKIKGLEPYLNNDKPENLITDYSGCHFIESGIWVRKSMLEVFAKNGIPYHNLVSFINGLCQTIDENSDSLTRKIDTVEWYALKDAQVALSHRAYKPNLYDAILESSKVSEEELSFASWCYLSLNLSWETRIQCFTDMPIQYLEKYSSEVNVWEHWFQILLTEEFSSIIAALKLRNDVYGEGNLPDDILTEILFGFNESDIPSMNRSYSGLATIASMMPFRLTNYYRNSKKNNNDKHLHMIHDMKRITLNQL